MVFLMGFKGIDRIQPEFGKESKQLIEIETPFPNRKMFVHLPVIVMEMNLGKIFPEGLQPDGKGNLAEKMVMAGIETKSKTG
jgi:hypothetical protein